MILGRNSDGYLRSHRHRWNLLLLRSFFHDPSSGLAGILGRALMSVKGFLYTPAFSGILKLENTSAF